MEQKYLVGSEIDVSTLVRVISLQFRDLSCGFRK